MQDTPGHPGKPVNPSTTLIRAPKPTPSVTAILFPHLITGPRSFSYKSRNPRLGSPGSTRGSHVVFPNPSIVHNRCRPATSRSKLSRVSPPSGNHEPHPKTCLTSTNPAPETGQDQRYLRGQLKLESVNTLEDAQKAGKRGSSEGCSSINPCVGTPTATTSHPRPASSASRPRSETAIASADPAAAAAVAEGPRAAGPPTDKEERVLR